MPAAIEADEGRAEEIDCFLVPERHLGDPPRADERALDVQLAAHSCFASPSISATVRGGRSSLRLRAEGAAISASNFRRAPSSVIKRTSHFAFCASGSAAAQRSTDRFDGEPVAFALGVAAAATRLGSMRK